MAVPVYTVRFGYGLATVGQSPVIYTVPGGITAVIRCIDIVSPGAGSTSSMQFRVGAAGFFWTVNFSQPLSHAQWTGRQVMMAGEQLFASPSQQSIYYYVTGYQFSAPGAGTLPAAS